MINPDIADKRLIDIYLLKGSLQKYRDTVADRSGPPLEDSLPLSKKIVTYSSILGVSYSKSESP